MSNQTIVTLAKVLSAAFIDGPRVSDETKRPVRVLKEDRAEWLSEVIRAAHGDMGPDDWRYEMIESVIDALANLEDDATEMEAIDAVDCVEASIYTSDLTRWLASRADRHGYCDEAVEQGYDFTTTTDLLMRGQEAEYREIGGLLIQALQKVADEMNAESEDEDAA